MKNIYFRDDNKLFHRYLTYFKIICLGLNRICKVYFFKLFVYSIYHLF